MNDDGLSNLLREMDATSPPPLLVGLVSAVHRRAQARSRRRRTGVTATALVVPMTAALFWVLHRPDPSTRRVAIQPPAAIDWQALQVESARLKAEADLQAAVATRLGARRDQRDRLARERARLAAAALAPTLVSERDKAALTLLDHGDRLRRELKRTDAALAAYRRTIELFPETRWAAAARQRINEMKPDARRSLQNQVLT